MTALVFLDTELTRRCPECGSAFQVNYRKSRKRFCGYSCSNTVTARTRTKDRNYRFDRHTAMGDALWTQAIYDRIVYDLAVGGER